MDKEKTQDSILDEFQGWAHKHDRPVNLTVIETLLAVRTARDAARQVWTAGDVAAALDRAVGIAPVAFLVGVTVLEDSLDAWFRFLRNTARLDPRSADVGVLRREARRAARTVADQALETVAELLDDEPEDPWDDPDDPRHENVQALRRIGIDSFDVLARTWGSRPDPELAAEVGWSSKYVARLRHLARAVGPSLELDGLLLPSVAVAEGLIARCPPGTFDGEVSRPGRRTGEPSLTYEFDSLWYDAHTARLVTLKDGRAVPGPACSGQQGESASQRLQPVVRVGRARFDDLTTDREFGAGLIYLAVTSLSSGCGWVSLQDVPARAPWPWFLGRCEIESPEALAEIRRSVRTLEEAAVVDYDIDGDRARLTSFGVWVIDSWLCEQFDPDTW
jgi:hypothetical protein